MGSVSSKGKLGFIAFSKVCLHQVSDKMWNLLRKSLLIQNTRERKLTWEVIPKGVLVHPPGIFEDGISGSFLLPPTQCQSPVPTLLQFHSAQDESSLEGLVLLQQTT